MVYLDNSATTSINPDVMDAMVKVMSRYYGNPSSLHEFGMKAEEALEQARGVISKKLLCAPKDILFTSGGTEANNLAIQGVAHRYQGRGKHLITSYGEHQSVYGVHRELERKGWRVTYLPIDSLGRVNPEDVERALTPETVLVSILHVNSEVGTIQPISDIGEIIHRYPRVFFHVDAVQSFGRIPLIPHENHIDLLSISAHKFHGPKGTGCLYRSNKVEIAPLFIGGDQENGIRPGTPNVPGIVGMARAIAVADQERVGFLGRCSKWKQILIERLTSSLCHIKVNGDVSEQGAVPYIISLSFPRLNAETLVHALEQKEVYVGTKSACSSKLRSPSRVLIAMGIDREAALGTLRISMGFETQEDHIHRVIEALEEVVPRYYGIVKVSTEK